MAQLKDLRALNSHSGCTNKVDHDREINAIDLLSPLEIRNIKLKNRIAMSPMCQYSSIEGLANDWHLVHLGSRAAGGASLVMVEATAVARDGRITPADMGIWEDRHIAPLARIAEFIHSQDCIAGIQLAHAGRKASCDVPWKGGNRLQMGYAGGWEVVAPSPIPFEDNDPPSKALTFLEIEQIIIAYEEAAKRALAAGFKIIEIHSAHGYLLHEFLSPISNQRTDAFGGNLENRMRLLLQIAERLRKIVPDSQPLFVRISATDWVEGGWDLPQSIILSENLKKLGVDLIDVSSGGMVPKATIPIGKGYQVPFSREIREKARIKTAAVGLITEVEQANDIITNGDADLIFLGREILKDPYWAIKAQQHLGEETSWPLQYGYAVKRRAK